MRAALVPLAIALGACDDRTLYGRGTAVSFQDAFSRKDDLPAFVEELIGAEQPAAAYHAYQLMRLRKFAADRMTQNSGTVPAGYANIEVAV